MVVKKLKECVICGQTAKPKKRVQNGVICEKCYKPPKQTCSVCGKLHTVAKWENDKSICHKCYKPKKHICSICGALRTVAKNKDDGTIVCTVCYYKEYDHSIGSCSKCGEVAIIYSRIGGFIICEKCYEPPNHICVECGNLLPSAKRVDGGNLCKACYCKLIKSICSLCGKLRRISCSSDGLSICGSCRNNQRYIEDETFRITCLLRRRLHDSINAYAAYGKVKTSKQYGIDYLKIAQYLGPCPGKREDFHIDHIFPLSAFNFNDPQQIKVAFAPENHRWLTKQVNLSKNDTYDKRAFEQYLKKHGCERGH